MRLFGGASWRRAGAIWMVATLLSACTQDPDEATVADARAPADATAEPGLDAGGGDAAVDPRCVLLDEPSSAGGCFGAATVEAFCSDTREAVLRVALYPPDGRFACAPDILPTPWGLTLVLNQGLHAPGSYRLPEEAVGELYEDTASGAATLAVVEGGLEVTTIETGLDDRDAVRAAGWEHRWASGFVDVTLSDGRRIAGPWSAQACNPFALHGNCD